MLTLTIPGKPIAKARPRFYRRGKFVGTYNSQETEEGRFLLECQSQLEGHELITGPISLTVCFRMPRPKGHYGTGRNAGKLKPSAPDLHIKKPDLDNMLKFVKDCLNGIVWKDDSQVFSVVADKYYADHDIPEAVPSTLILIYEHSETSGLAGASKESPG